MMLCEGCGCTEASIDEQWVDGENERRSEERRHAGSHLRPDGAPGGGHTEPAVDPSGHGIVLKCRCWCGVHPFCVTLDTQHPASHDHKDIAAVPITRPSSIGASRTSTVRAALSPTRVIPQAQRVNKPQNSKAPPVVSSNRLITPLRGRERVVWLSVWPLCRFHHPATVATWQSIRMCSTPRRL